MIDGMPSKTFSFSTLPPPEPNAEEGRREKIVRLSRERYCTPREVVEDKIKRWAESGDKNYSDENGEKPRLPRYEKKILEKPRAEGVKSETRNPKHETGSPKTETHGAKPQAMPIGRQAHGPKTEKQKKR
jgi:hypothetical protein